MVAARKRARRRLSTDRRCKQERAQLRLVLTLQAQAFVRQRVGQCFESGFDHARGRRGRQVDELAYSVPNMRKYSLELRLVQLRVCREHARVSAASQVGPRGAKSRRARIPYDAASRAELDIAEQPDPAGAVPVRGKYTGECLRARGRIQVAISARARTAAPFRLRNSGVRLAVARARGSHYRARNKRTRYTRRGCTCPADETCSILASLPPDTAPACTSHTHLATTLLSLVRSLAQHAAACDGSGAQVPSSRPRRHLTSAYRPSAL